MGLPCHDGEVEGVVMEDDAVLLLGIRGRARYAQAHVPKRRSHHRVPRVLQGWLLVVTCRLLQVRKIREKGRNYLVK
jgi:hypothetical protein